jgi:hypothetical protein
MFTLASSRTLLSLINNTSWSRELEQALETGSGGKLTGRFA